MTTTSMPDASRQAPWPAPSRPLGPGERAPDFLLPVTPDEKLSLSSLLGRPVILVFYPADFSPVCGDELALYNELYGELRRRHGAELVGISVDGPWCHAAYKDQRRFRFPLLSDFEPKGEVAKQYGVYRYGDGVAERGLFVLEPDGVIHWSDVSPPDINPGADGILQALEQLEQEDR